MKRPTEPLAFGEFIALLALTVSLVAMSTDIMLPGLADIGRDLCVTDINKTQYVVSIIFIGYGIGQLLAGPLSDAFGRKPIIYLGLAIFIAGSLLSMLATNFYVMLAGRVLQGFGAAGPRVVPVALVRDGYEGRVMARIMSFIMAVFMLVPALAPAVGQVVIMVAGWRACFALLLAMASIAFVWFSLRQPETLPSKNRRRFTLASLGSGMLEACRIRATVGYTLTTGLVFGAFLSYLATSRQIFQDIYDTGDWFALYFGMAAIALGAGSITSSKLVVRIGMQPLVVRGLVIATLASWAFLTGLLSVTAAPPLWLFMVWLLILFGFRGFVFGNINALAMEPLGHMAGLGASIIGSVSTLIALSLSVLIGAQFDGTIMPLVVGFAVLDLAALGVIAWTEKGSKS